jgi:hypothetical protein
MLVYNPQIEGFNYIPMAEKGEEVPFSVKLKTVNSIELAQLTDGLLQRSADDNVSLRTGSYNVGICKSGIIGWAGMTDVNGKEISITLTRNGTIDDASLNKIPAPMFEEIAGVIASVSQDPATLQLFISE